MLAEKMSLKLTVKCLVRLSASIKNLMSQDVRVFDVLIELYKLFKVHPPEQLKVSTCARAPTHLLTRRINRRLPSMT